MGGNIGVTISTFTLVLYCKLAGQFNDALETDKSTIILTHAMILKAVIVAAGLGTRLLSFTKEQPKEMLPIFSLDGRGVLRLKPMLQLIFEQIYDFGIRDFCFVIGRGKRAIEDHFTPDYTYVEMLKKKGSSSSAAAALDLESFYWKVNESNIFWVNQAQPLGFGHAVLQAQPHIGNNDFLLYAGDTLVVSENNRHLSRLSNCYEKEAADIAFLVQNVSDPENYGVVFGSDSDNNISVKRVEEKPLKPESNLAIMPVYIFKHKIFDHLKATKAGSGNEIQLTDAIQATVQGGRVFATRILEGELRLDIGTPETYFSAQSDSFRYCNRGKIVERA